jgi:DHA2 family multidrug resistance protein
MLLVGQLSAVCVRHQMARGLGFVVLAYALWAMSSWTLDVSVASVRFVMIVSGLGTGLIFPVMSKATLGCVEKERMGYAASLYGMMRNIGGAIGISLVSNLLNSREQTHTTTSIGCSPWPRRFASRHFCY